MRSKRVWYLDLGFYYLMKAVRRADLESPMVPYENFIFIGKSNFNEEIYICQHQKRIGQIRFNICALLSIDKWDGFARICLYVKH